MAGEALLAEMEALRDRVAGITDTALATRDGLIIKADTVDVDPDNIAAMAAAMIGLAQRMTAEAGRGTLHEAVVQGSGGYVATYAVGTSALLVVVGDAGLDVTHLYRESRQTVENLNHLMTGTGVRRPAGDSRNLRLWSSRPAADTAIEVGRVVVFRWLRCPPFAGASQPGVG
jgi:uncharacterized protein